MAEMTVWEKLAYPFEEKFVYWFKKGGVDLAYLDARTVMDRLDQVVGPENWSDKYEETPSGRILCTLAIAVDINGQRVVISKTDGAGDTSIEGEKGGISDAFKRAAARFGIGRYLYRLAGPSGVTGRLPDWAMPGGPPVPTAYTDFPSEGNAKASEEGAGKEADDAGSDSVDEDNVVDLDEARVRFKMAEQFTELQERGIKEMGLDAYTNTVNFILEQGYGGLSWKKEDIDIEVARSMYTDISKAISNHKKGAS